MRGDMEESLRMKVSAIVDNATTSNHMDMIKKQNQADGQCHTGHNCALHVCAGFSINSSISNLNTIAATHSYLVSQYSPLYSTALSAEIKPPILIL